MIQGLIISGTKREYRVRLDSGEIVSATVRKSLIYNTGSLYIGDRVSIDQDGCIADRADRFNLLIRPRIANVSFGAIVTSTYEPKFSSFLLDKYLSYLIYSSVTPLILFSKIDRLNHQELKTIFRAHEYYQKLGIESFLLSTHDLKTFAPLIETIRGKTVVMMGQTGAGKSSALNIIDPNLKRAIGEYSVALGRGKHQTKEVVLFPFADGYIGDTPGFSSLELPFDEKDLANCFPGFAISSHRCYYNNCLHLKEQKCTIVDRLSRGEISAESYDNYLKLLKEIKENRR